MGTGTIGVDDMQVDARQVGGTCMKQNRTIEMS